MTNKLSANDILLSNFPSPKGSEQLFNSIKTFLGFEYNYEVVRLAIALSMSDDSTYPKDVNSSPPGVKGSYLFDQEEFPIWIGLIITNYIQFHPDIKEITLPILQSAVKAHCNRGINIIENIINICKRQPEKFWSYVLDNYFLELPAIKNKFNDNNIKNKIIVTSGPLKITIGKTISKIGQIEGSFEHILNGKGYSPHVAIMGQAGSGKTVLMTKFLRQIRNQSNCPIVLLDLGKGELGKDKDLINTLGASVIQVPDEPVPLDVFASRKNSEQLAEDTMNNFRDSLSQISSCKLGPIQKTNIAEATLPLFKSNEQISLKQLETVISDYYYTHDIKEDSVTSTMKELTRRDLFIPKYTQEDFFNKNWVITFANARDDIKNFSVCLILSALDYYLKSLDEASLDSNGYRTIKIVLAIDEARHLLNLSHPALASIIRLHRSKGLSVILVSQSPDDYDGKNDDYLENIGLPVCLKTNATSTKTLKNMFKQKISFADLHPLQCYTIDVESGKLIKVQFDLD